MVDIVVAAGVVVVVAVAVAGADESVEAAGFVGPVVEAAPP